MENNLNCLNFLSSLYKKGELSFYCNTKEEYNVWKRDTLNRLAEILGLTKLKAVEPKAEIISEEDMGAYTRQKIIINTMDQLKMVFYKLVPKENGNNVPVIAIHGHGSDGKNVLVGVIKDKFKAAYKRFSYTYAMDMVERGYTVFVPDLLGSGDRKYIPDPSKVECNDINNVCISLGISLIGIHITEMLALIEYILTDKSLISQKLMIMGFSGGAILTLFTSAFCEKVYYTAVSGFFHGFKNTMLTSNFCGCNFVPHLWDTVDMGDIGALIAPRYLYIEAGNQDKLNGIGILENVYPQLEITKKAYSLFGSDKIEFKAFDGAHRWYGGCYDAMDHLVKEIDSN